MSLERLQIQCTCCVFLHCIWYIHSFLHIQGFYFLGMIWNKTFFEIVTLATLGGRSYQVLEWVPRWPLPWGALYETGSGCALGTEGSSVFAPLCEIGKDLLWQETTPFSSHSEMPFLTPPNAGAFEGRAIRVLDPEHSDICKPIKWRLCGPTLEVGASCCTQDHFIQGFGAYISVNQKCIKCIWGWYGELRKAGKVCADDNNKYMCMYIHACIHIHQYTYMYLHVHVVKVSHIVSNNLCWPHLSPTGTQVTAFSGRQRRGKTSAKWLRREKGWLGWMASRRDGDWLMHPFITKHETCGKLSFWSHGFFFVSSNNLYFFRLLAPRVNIVFVYHCHLLVFPTFVHRSQIFGNYLQDRTYDLRWKSWALCIWAVMAVIWPWCWKAQLESYYAM